MAVLVVCMAFIGEASAEGTYFSPIKITVPPIKRIQVSKEPAPIYEPDAERQPQVDIVQQSYGYYKPLSAQQSNLNNYQNLQASTIPKITQKNIQPPVYQTSYSVPPSNINGYPNTLAYLNSFSQQKASKQLYASRPLAQNNFKTTITYPDSPSVSHTTFTGLGTTYTW